MIDAVVFDVGETLIDETRQNAAWADWLGVPRHTFSAMFGAVVATGREFRDVFGHFKPGFDLAIERQRRAAAGDEDEFTAADLYPDTRPCLTALHDLGVWVGIAGNQPSTAGDVLRAMDLPVDLIETSQDWGVNKPDPRFFAAVLAAVPFPPERIAYVGDRVDNEMKPARAAAADWQVGSLAEIPPLIAAANRA